jgi:CRP-like cAMP-binding protein
LSLSSEAQFNHLLAVFPQDTMARLLGTLELVDLKRGEMICRSGEVCAYVYFPTSATISLLSVMEDGASAGIALVGNEGVVGISQFLGGGSTPTHAAVQSAGKCIRINARSMKEEFNRIDSVRDVLLRYTLALITQTTQTAVCNRHHSVYQQFCRFLLQSLDRVNGSKLTITHDLVGVILGVRRESVTKAARELQNDGLIKYARGHVTVLDREAVEACACECYSVVSKEYVRLLPKFTTA